MDDGSRPRADIRAALRRPQKRSWSAGYPLRLPASARLVMRPRGSLNVLTWCFNRWPAWSRARRLLGPGRFAIDIDPPIVIQIDQADDRNERRVEPSWRVSSSPHSFAV